MSTRQDLQKADGYLRRAKECVVDIERYIEQKEKQLAEKPKLRHGDYGRGRLGVAFFCNGDGTDSVFIRSDKRKARMLHGETGGRYRYAEKFGNIFDDLERNTVDLEEFSAGVYSTTRNSIRAKIVDDEIRFFIEYSRGCETRSTHDLESAIEFHQKLGQLIATAKRKQAK